MKIIKLGWYFCLTLIIASLCIVAIAYYKTKPQNTGTIVVAGLQGPVIIKRDQYGIPHIYASKSDNDAFFALGYVHAQDRFWQMEFQRRITQGTLSEIFGDTTLKQDEYLRTFGFYRAAQSCWPALDKQTQSLIHSYTLGVNAYLNQGRLPLEIQLLHYKPNPWTDVDTLAWSKMMAFDLQGLWKNKIIDYLIAKKLGVNQLDGLLPSYPQQAPTILSDADLEQNNLISKNSPQPSPYAAENNSLNANNNLQTFLNDVSSLNASLGIKDDAGKGSNNWVVNGKLSASGKPLLANDPHLSLQNPNIWYLAELNGPHLHVIGATVPGLPAVLIGHNNNIAWGVTNVNPDTQDLYFESPKSLQARHEIIKVRNQPDVDYVVYQSVHGPIINSILANYGYTNSQPLALKWTALMAGDTTVRSIIGIDYAQNWQQFVNALQYYIGPTQNFVYADTQGNIGYYAPGRIPLRNGWSGSLPIGVNEHLEWDGYISFDQLPHAYNPAENFIATANNAVVSKNYPYALTFRWQEPPFRINRILDLLERSKSFTVADFANIQLDTDSYLWRYLKPELLATKPVDLQSTQALQILKNWDGYTNLDSQGAVVFAYWYAQLIKMPLAEINFLSEWSEPLFIQQQLSTNGSYCRDLTTHTCGPYLSKTLAQAMKQLAAQQGDDSTQWRWRNVHIALFKELGFGEIAPIAWIWNRHIPTPGSLYTVNVGTYNENDFIQNKGAGYRQIVDLNNFNNSVFIQSFGQSGNIFSKHYDDLLELWRNGRYLPMTTDEASFGKTQVLTLQAGK